MKIPPDAFDKVPSEIRFRCSQCHGSGMLEDKVCPYCKGAQSRQVSFSPTTEDTEDLERVDEIDRDEGRHAYEDECGGHDWDTAQDNEQSEDWNNPRDEYINPDSQKYKDPWDDEDGIPF